MFRFKYLSILFYCHMTGDRVYVSMKSYQVLGLNELSEDVKVRFKQVSS